MPKYISLLRGINVSGKNKIKMQVLKDLYQTLGFEQVSTYIQSGNVAFSSVKTEAKEIENEIKIGIKTQFTYDVSVLVKNELEIKELLANNPFLVQNKETGITKLHVTILAQTPDNELLEKLKIIQHKNNQWFIQQKNIYLFCPDGYGRTKFTNTFFEKKLKVTATTRNWKTCNKLGAMLLDIK